MNYVKPHTPEWFKKLEAVNPVQAEFTKAIVNAAEKPEVCSTCGDDPAADYKVVGVRFKDGTDATIRLCNDCRIIRAQTQDELYELIE